MFTFAYLREKIVKICVLASVIIIRPCCKFKSITIQNPWFLKSYIKNHDTHDLHYLLNIN